jgi:predicted acylesterase/phospholipase RssA
VRSLSGELEDNRKGTLKNSAILVGLITRTGFVVTVEAGLSAGRFSDETLVNGVFKGGGAKGVAYAGALRAFREAGYWFGSVAGASAGAITATLIAAGLTPDEIETQVPIALGQLAGSIPVRLFSLVRGSTSSLFDSEKLRGWLEVLLNQECRKRGVVPNGPVSFDDLFAATGMELYVVAMDLASGTPVVFSRRTTPWVEVSSAVTSSCAIPGAFPPGRVVFNHPHLGAGVHQLVDGGTFANYPTFVFKDQSFQRWIGTQDDAQHLRLTVGFVLGEPEQIDRRMEAVGFVGVEKPTISKHFDIGPTYTAESTGSYAFGAILSNDWARLALFVSIVVWAGLSIGFFPQGVRLVATWLGFVPGPVFALAVVGLFVVLILTAGGALLSIVALISISRMVSDTILPAAKSAIGVATEVVPWSGFGDDDILLVVPHRGLETTRFDVPESVRNSAVNDAYIAVKAQMADPVLSSKLGIAPAVIPTPPLPPQDRAIAPQLPLWRQLSKSLVLATVLAVGVGVLGWAAVNAQSDASWFWQSLLIGVGSLVAAIIGMVAFAKSAGGRAAAHARVGIGKTQHATGPATIALGVALLLFGGGLLLSGHAAKVRKQSTYQVKIAFASLDAAGKRYAFVRDGQVHEFVDSRDFALGERIYVKQDASGEVGVVSPLESAVFPVAVTLEVLGLGLFLAAYRASSWAKRSNRLVAWLAKRRRPLPAPHPSHHVVGGASE